jgi:hypothetical protein
MSTFTIGNFSSSAYTTGRGQSFTPNVKGDGTGVPDGTNPVYLKNVMIAYPTSDTSSRQGRLYLYTSKPSLSDLNNSGTNSLAMSTGYTDENGFGAGTYTRTFNFSTISLDVASKYYVLFSSNQSLCFASGSPYTGGELLNGALGNTAYDARFQVLVADTMD